MREIKVVRRQDDDCHWYWIPQEEAADFDLDLEKIEGKEYLDCPDDFDRFNEDWGDFRTGGSPELEPEGYKRAGLKPII